MNYDRSGKPGFHGSFGKFSRVTGMIVLGVMAGLVGRRAGAQTLYVSSDPQSVYQVTSSGTSIFVSLTSTSLPTGLAFDEGGNLYVAENNLGNR